MFMVKIDIAKAYDSISWQALGNVLEAMNFGPQWIQWIRLCVYNAKVTILINGSPSEFVQIKRGLRQGDPMSPYLFLLVAEILSALINSAVYQGLIKGFKVDRDEFQLCHIQFADDTIFFVEADNNNLIALRRILRIFRICTGMKVNFSKSQVFGVNVDNDCLKAASATLGCKIGSWPCNYLGFPIGGKNSTKSIWVPVVNKIKKHLTSWKKNSLSQVGRLTLIKSVINLIPTYFLSLFCMPVCVVKEIEALKRGFFGGTMKGGGV